MVDVAVLPGFVAVILLFLAPPGPDMAYVLAAGLEGGRRFALQAILGIGTGMSAYATTVVVGVGRLAESYPLLLDGVKVLGAAYLLWLAWVTIRSAHAGIGGGITHGRPYVRGVVVSLTNPKLLLFFLAVLPQFTGDARSTAMQLAMLGIVNVLTEVVLYGSIGLAAGAFHSHVTGSRSAGVLLSRLAAVVYLGLAGVVAVEVVAG